MGDRQRLVATVSSSAITTLRPGNTHITDKTMIYDCVRLRFKERELPATTSSDNVQRELRARGTQGTRMEQNHFLLP